MPLLNLGSQKSFGFETESVKLGARGLDTALIYGYPQQQAQDINARLAQEEYAEEVASQPALNPKDFKPTHSLPRLQRT